MCQDQKRVDAYRAALLVTCRDKVVVDVGSGTGILAFAAIDAGANTVYAIEKATIAS